MASSVSSRSDCEALIALNNLVLIMGLSMAAGSEPRVPQK
jgi:hypothetical protein